VIDGVITAEELPMYKVVIDPTTRKIDSDETDKLRRKTPRSLRSLMSQRAVHVTRKGTQSWTPASTYHYVASSLLVLDIFSSISIIIGVFA